MDFSHEEAINGAALIRIAEGLTTLILALRNIAIALGVLFVIIGGIQYATSSGDPEKVAGARQTVTWAIIAIILAIVFWVILGLLSSWFGVAGINEGEIILQDGTIFDFDNWGGGEPPL